MPITTKNKVYAFVAAILILLLPTLVLYFTKSTPVSVPPTMTPSPAPAATPRGAPTNDTSRQSPPAMGAAIQPPIEAGKAQKGAMANSLIRPANLGQTITVEGVPVNYGAEAAIAINGGAIVWIKGISPWPKDLFSRQGMQVRVTGVLSEDYGGRAVVWDDKAGRQGMPQGHPVPPGRDLKKVNHRFVILDADWKTIDK